MNLTKFYMYCPKCGHKTNNCIPPCKVCKYYMLKMYMSTENLNREISKANTLKNNTDKDILMDSKCDKQFIKNTDKDTDEDLSNYYFEIEI